MASALIQGARGGAVTMVAQALKIIVQFVNVIVLSRLLGPDDFGLIAMVAAFVALGELIRDFGTSVVGLGRRDLSQQQASNLFWMSAVLGLTAAALLAVSAPLLVHLYSEPRLLHIAPVLAIGLVLNALAAQFSVQLSRQMQYWRRLIADVGAPIAGLVVAIVGGLAGWDYWALVAQTLGSALAGLTLRVALSGWRPSWPRRQTGNAALVKDSAGFGFAHLMQYVSQNIDTVLIGARWDAASLGGYNRAFQLLTMPIRQMVTPLSQVVVPTVHRAMHEGKSIDFVLLRVQFGVGLVTNWVYAISAGIADWLLPFLLGEQWSSTILLFQILAVGGAVWIFSVVSYWVFIINNLGKQLFYYSIFTKGLSSLLIIGASFISIEMVAWAVSIGLIVAWPVNLIWLWKVADFRPMIYFRNGCLLLFATAAAFAATWVGMQILTEYSGFIRAGLSALFGTIIYLATIAALPAGASNLKNTLALLRKAM